MQFVPGSVEQSISKSGFDRGIELRKPATLTHRREDIDRVLTLYRDFGGGSPFPHGYDIASAASARNRSASWTLPADTKSSNRKRQETSGTSSDQSIASLRKTAALAIGIPCCLTMNSVGSLTNPPGNVSRLVLADQVSLSAGSIRPVSSTPNDRQKQLRNRGQFQVARSILPGTLFPKHRHR